MIVTPRRLSWNNNQDQLHKKSYVRLPMNLRTAFVMPLSDSPRHSAVQPSLSADAWVCRSCGEFFEYARPQAAPSSCPSCLGTRFSAVLTTHHYHHRLSHGEEKVVSRPAPPAFTE
jgi:rubrerythrin